MSKRREYYELVLKKYFNYDKLKDKQYKIIDYIVKKKRDVCAILATGFGKSLCYQLPFLITKKSVIVTIFCDHGSRYMSKIYSDKWMHDQGFEEKSIEQESSIEYIR